MPPPSRTGSASLLADWGDDPRRPRPGILVPASERSRSRGAGAEVDDNE